MPAAAVGRGQQPLWQDSFQAPANQLAQGFYPSPQQDYVQQPQMPVQPAPAQNAPQLPNAGVQQSSWQQGYQLAPQAPPSVAQPQQPAPLPQQPAKPAASQPRPPVQANPQRVPSVRPASTWAPPMVVWPQGPRPAQSGPADSQSHIAVQGPIDPQPQGNIDYQPGPLQADSQDYGPSVPASRPQQPAFHQPGVGWPRQPVARPQTPAQRPEPVAPAKPVGGGAAKESRVTAAPAVQHQPGMQSGHADYPVPPSHQGPVGYSEGGYVYTNSQPQDSGHLHDNPSSAQHPSGHAGRVPGTIGDSNRHPIDNYLVPQSQDNTGLRPYETSRGKYPSSGDIFSHGSLPDPNGRPQRPSRPSIDYNLYGLNSRPYNRPASDSYAPTYDNPYYSYIDPSASNNFLYEYNLEQPGTSMLSSCRTLL